MENENFGNEKNQFIFERLKKTNEIGRSQTMNERNEKSRTCPSLFKTTLFNPPVFICFKLIYTLLLSTKPHYFFDQFTAKTLQHTDSLADDDTYQVNSRNN